MLEGRIVKGIGGFYYVETSEGLIESRARGVFRENNQKPLVGDKVKVRISKEDESGYIDEIYPRKSSLKRPEVANISQNIIVMSIEDPDINLWLLDRFIVLSEYEGLDIVICLNKVDLNLKKAQEIEKIYRDIGYKVILTSSIDGLGIDRLHQALKDNISVFSGPSGAGKSSLLNTISGLDLEVGKVSSKTKRGKHTTRHAELFKIDTSSYVLDTPGFSSLSLDFIKESSDLENYFIDIGKYSEDCKFISCIHRNEPECGVKNKLSLGILSAHRYENYLKFLEEIETARRY